MILEPRDVTCIRCGTVSTQNTAHRRTPSTELRDRGLDGRDRADAEPKLEQCPRCGWLAPDIGHAYPRLAEHDALRRVLDERGDHVVLARRYMGLAQLLGDGDPGGTARWLRRAAWADDDAGYAVGAQLLRLRAGRLLEDLLAQGHALAPACGLSSLLLTELFRVGGDRSRAALHCGRGLRARAKSGIRALLAYEAFCLREGRREPATVGQAIDALDDTQRRDVVRDFLADLGTLPRLALAPRRDRPFLFPRDASDVFALDFLHDGEDLHAFLRAGLPVSAAVSGPIVDALCQAVDDPAPEVRDRALAALDGMAIGDEPLSDAAVGALLARLGDDTFRSVRDAGSVLRQIVARHPRHRERVRVVVQRVLPRWKDDPPTEGNLERILGAVEPRALQPPAPGCTAPRSYRELAFAASLEPCPVCRDRCHPGSDGFLFEALDDPPIWRASWTCSCGERRMLEASTAGANDLARMSVGSLDELAGGASAYVAPERFAAELERLRPLVRPPDDLPPIEWRVRSRVLRDARIVAAELHKLAVARGRGGDVDRAAIEAQLARLDALRARFAEDAPRIAQLEPRPGSYAGADARYGVVRGLSGELRDLVEHGRAGPVPPDAAAMAAPWLPKAVSATREDDGALLVRLGTDVASMRFRDATTEPGIDVEVDVHRGTVEHVRRAVGGALTRVGTRGDGSRHVARVDGSRVQAEIEVFTIAPGADGTDVDRVVVRFRARDRPVRGPAEASRRSADGAAASPRVVPDAPSRAVPEVPVGTPEEIVRGALDEGVSRPSVARADGAGRGASLASGPPVDAAPGAARYDLRIPFGARRCDDPVERPLRLLWLGDYTGKEQFRGIFDRKPHRVRCDDLLGSRARLGPRSTADVARRWDVVEAAAARIGGAPSVELEILVASRACLVEDHDGAAEPARMGLHAVLVGCCFGSHFGEPYAAVFLEEELMAELEDSRGWLEGLRWIAARRAHLPVFVPRREGRAREAVPPFAAWVREVPIVETVGEMVDAFTATGLVSTRDAALIDMQLARTLKLVARHQMNRWSRDRVPALRAVLTGWLGDRTGAAPGALFRSFELRLGEETRLGERSPGHIAFELDHQLVAPLPQERRTVTGVIQLE